MDRPSRERDETLVAPTGDSCSRAATSGVYATGRPGASVGHPPAPAYSWPDWTDAVRYTVTRTWPDRPGGDA